MRNRTHKAILRVAHSVLQCEVSTVTFAFLFCETQGKRQVAKMVAENADNLSHVEKQKTRQLESNRHTSFRVLVGQAPMRFVLQRISRVFFHLSKGPGL